MDEVIRRLRQDASGFRLMEHPVAFRWEGHLHNWRLYKDVADDIETLIKAREEVELELEDIPEFLKRDRILRDRRMGGTLSQLQRNRLILRLITLALAIR